MNEHKVTQMEFGKNASEAERALRAMIDALVLSDPGLKERLNIGACLHYLKLDDRTFGWNGDSSKPLTLEQKIACVMPTIANGLPPGYVVWMGHRPYALAEAWTHVVNRDVEKVSGMRWRPLTDEERTMFCIQDGDMALAVEEKVCIRGREIHWVGYGILGADEMLPNHNGKYKVATRLTRDKVQFLRTRAVRDMYRRNYSLSGLSEVEELELDTRPGLRPMENVTPAPAPTDDPEVNSTVVSRFTTLTGTARNLGGHPEDFIKVSLPEWLTQSSASAISDVSDAIEHWIAQKQKADAQEPLLKAK
ncbi:MAG TPA: hypothetical protein VE954_35080 [Oligoflexus sp.]|uniref:hypothetical protein n=1 Tax=Oligoflexus sp. TaxID=1971216 RepID=UPI002D46EC4C|nr:hypothetical protein [Oligoflexus sp.]HYX38356.1 hypothetical protein [Oligoflexus sp.]